jgi:NAD kinase
VIERLDVTMVRLDIYINEVYATTISADGVIIASSTGSTAYNLSTGGCIIHPSVHSIILNAIAPMSLSHRPLVLPKDTVLSIKINENSRGLPRVVFDG